MMRVTVFKAPKAGGVSAIVRYLDPGTALAVDELERHLRANVEPLATSLVFTAAEGGYLRRSNFRRRVWVPATEAVGVPGFRFHDLRHTGATLAAATGAPLRALMSRMGHATPVAALRYQHLVAGQDAAIARALDDCVGRSSMPPAKPLRQEPYYG